MTASSSKIKLPEFMPEDPFVWWRSCESTFEAFKVKSEVEKHHHLVAALPPKVLTQIRDILVVVPATKEEDTRFEALKQKLLKLFAPNAQESFEKLFQVPMLQQGQKPSVLCSSLRACVPPDVDVSSSGGPWFMKGMFLKRLRNI